MAEPALQHLPLKERSPFQKEWGVTFCIRCGAMLAWDDHPELVIKKSCHEFGREPQTRATSKPKKKAASSTVSTAAKKTSRK